MQPCSAACGRPPRKHLAAAQGPQCTPAVPMLGWSPVVNGLHLGELVELRGLDGPEPGVGSDDADFVLYGQLVEYLPDREKFAVALIDTGAVLHVDTASVAPAGTEHGLGFDAVLGPRTEQGALGSVMSNSLSEKGYCVLRLVRGSGEPAACLACLLEHELAGRLGRLALEVEEGYLGRGARAKAMWLDPEDPALNVDSALTRCDATLTSLAELLQVHAEDALRAPLEERTPALVCMSMTDVEEAEYESPALTDQILQDYYSTWCRALLRVVLFTGPANSSIVLKLKESAPISSLDRIIRVAAPANTVVIVREDSYEYSCSCADGGEACWLQSFIMKQAPQWTLSELEGDLGLFDTVGEGPPPPSEEAKNRIAVVGMSIQACGRMTDHHKEWSAYIAGTDGQMEMPMSRFDYRPYYNDDVDTPLGTYVKHFSVQEGIDMFDNRVFEISNNEAAALDPLCRQVLEVGYLSILQIGITKKHCNTNPIHASVSVGCDKQEWLNMPNVPTSVAANNQLAICANRFNYVFNLKGGSYVMDTACSSSLCAAHLGKVNLLERRWDPLEWHLGLGAGVTLTVQCFFGNCAAHMLSPSGRCLTFNATANGYNRGDGTSCMCIKAGSHDSERIAYFRGSQIGQDGRSASMSAPNGPAQEKCVWGAIREAQMTPPESTVWECHGTGTSLGDPIEVGAVRKVQIKMKRTEPLMVATSKSNFGHLEGSAAQLAMNKCIMQVIMLVCCPTQHLKTLNAHLDHAAFDAIFISEHCPYKYRQGHCQVSSFGVGGTNGHAIFWGEGKDKVSVDVRKAFLLKVKKGPPSIIADGPRPSDWEFSGIAPDVRPGEKYRVTFLRDQLTKDETIRYEKVEDTEEIAEYYCTTGNHNDWDKDRMIEGDVPGLFYQEIEMPKDGVLQFRFLADGDPAKVIGPEVSTSRKTTRIIGPAAGLDTYWLVSGEPGSEVRVEFMVGTSPALGGLRTILWIPIRE
uniref:Type I polyketide synthase n=1 Tax=Gambierdiscus excentricus TaxID=986170 RepID=A0A1S6K7Z6_9DINO|nr:type I polyketide synthase [Gambierdiscus excentricus]